MRAAAPEAPVKFQSLLFWKMTVSTSWATIGVIWTPAMMIMTAAMKAPTAVTIRELPPPMSCLKYLSRARALSLLSFNGQLPFVLFSCLTLAMLYTI